jgi:hypothetical protein
MKLPLEEALRKAIRKSDFEKVKEFYAKYIELHPEEQVKLFNFILDETSEYVSDFTDYLRAVAKAR